MSTHFYVWIVSRWHGNKNPNYRDVAFVHTAIDCRVGLDFFNRCRRLCDNRHITSPATV
jgi:hypothetical protein